MNGRDWRGTGCPGHPWVSGQVAVPMSRQVPMGVVALGPARPWGQHRTHAVVSVPLIIKGDEMEPINTGGGEAGPGRCPSPPQQPQISLGKRAEPGRGAGGLQPSGQRRRLSLKFISSQDAAQLDLPGARINPTSMRSTWGHGPHHGQLAQRGWGSPKGGW